MWPLPWCHQLQTEIADRCVRTRSSSYLWYPDHRYRRWYLCRRAGLWNRSRLHLCTRERSNGLDDDRQLNRIHHDHHHRRWSLVCLTVGSTVHCREEWEVLPEFFLIFRDVHLEDTDHNGRAQSDASYFHSRWFIEEIMNVFSNTRRCHTFWIRSTDISAHHSAEFHCASVLNQLLICVIIGRCLTIEKP